MPSISVVILTFNEERHIARAIESAKPIATRIVVVDSYSTDRTVDIARELGAEILQNTFVSQAKQFQWAADSASLETDWIMRLDADEVIEPDLAEEIAVRLPTIGPEIAGINLKRKHIFLDRWIRHGGRYPLVMLRIFRRGQGRIEDRWMDEHIMVWGGGTVIFEGGFADWNLNDLTYFTAKHNSYATREALDVLTKQFGAGANEDTNSEGEWSRSAATKRFIKEKLYNKLPFWMGPFAYFVYRFFFQLGFLDGREGMIYHFLQGFWYRFLVGAKIEEFSRHLKPLKSDRERLVKLEELTGYKLV